MYDPYFFGLFPLSTLRTLCVLAKREMLQNRCAVYPLLRGLQPPVTELVLFGDFTESTS